MEYLTNCCIFTSSNPFNFISSPPTSHPSQQPARSQRSAHDSLAKTAKGLHLREYPREDVKKHNYLCNITRAYIESFPRVPEYFTRRFPFNRREIVRTRLIIASPANNVRANAHAVAKLLFAVQERAGALFPGRASRSNPQIPAIIFEKYLCIIVLQTSYRREAGRGNNFDASRLRSSATPEETHQGGVEARG